MSKMQVVEGYRVTGRRDEAAEGYVKEFTRHSDDVLLNLNELRHRDILTDATLLVGSARLRAHCAVLIACSGFFYSLFSRRLPGSGEERGVSVSLPEGLEAGSVSLLLDFMYTSRLPLTPRTVPGVLAAATYLQMEHVADTCRAFMLHSEHLPGNPPLLELASTPPAVCRALPGEVLSSPPLSGRSPAALPSDTSRPAAEAEERCRDTARVPGESWASLEPGTRLSRESWSQSLKLEESESLLLGPSPDSPSRSSCQPNSPAESSGCNLSPHQTTRPDPRTAPDPRPAPDPKACNWKKYKYIVLNPLCASTVKEEEGPGEGPQEFGHSSSSSSSSDTERMDTSPKPTNEAWLGDGLGLNDRMALQYGDPSPPSSSRQAQTSRCGAPRPKLPAASRPADTLPEPPTPQEGTASGSLYQHSCPPKLEPANHNRHSLCKHPIKRENHSSPFCYSGNLGGVKAAITGEKPYRCNVCGAQFNRPANLKTHARIHSGEKPYRCDTCGARFVQVAHLRAHVLIHTGEKPYPCHTCGTRFRHLQTLKSHLRIHTGEKPYNCEKCDLHFRHKSQLRLHLRQKHGAITNTKIRYKVLVDPYHPAGLQAC